MHYFENKGLGQSTITWHVQYTCFCQLFFYFFYFFLIFFSAFDSIFLHLVKKNQNYNPEYLWKENHTFKYHLCHFLCVKIYVIFWDCSKCIMYTYSNEYKYELSFYEQQQKSLVPTFTFLISSSATLNVCYSLYQVTRSRIWALPHT